METISKRHKLYVMIGVPGSGKSTYIAEKLKGVNVVSRDAIRFSMISNKDDYFSKENEVWDEFIQQIKDSLIVNAETVADATHLNMKSRAKLFRALGKSLKDVDLIAIYIKTPTNVCIARNENRTDLAYVPISAIRRMANQVEEPDPEEGWNYIFIYDTVTEKMEMRAI